MTTTEAGWLADPTGRHQHRYWNGTEWTEHVANDGTQAADPLETAAVTSVGSAEDVSGDGEDEVDAIEDEGAVEEEVSGGPRLKRFAIAYTNYLGGHPIREKKKDGGVLRFDAEGVHLRGVREIFLIPWSEVTELAVEGSEEVQRRVTATRLLTIGVFAFAAKKKGPKTAFVTVATGEGEAIFECAKTGPHEIRAKLTSAIAWVKGRSAPASGSANPVAAPASQPQSPVAAPSQAPDALEQIKRLSELHAAGALTDEEFTEKKAELLQRL